MKDQAKAEPVKMILILVIMIVAGLGLLWLANNVPWGFVDWIY